MKAYKKFLVLALVLTAAAVVGAPLQWNSEGQKGREEC